MTCSTAAFHGLLSRTSCSMLALNIAKQDSCHYMSTHMFWLKTFICGVQNNLHVSAGPVCVLVKPSTGYQP
jgi:hypothetical protein